MVGSGLGSLGREEDREIKASGLHRDSGLGGGIRVGFLKRREKVMRGEERVSTVRKERRETTKMA